MPNSLRLVMLMVLLPLVTPSSAYAGMPSVTVDFTDLAKMRLDTLSFFIVAYFLIAWGVKWFWNDLRKTFPAMPQISYWRSLVLLTMWALLFVVVLTMISGARELLTPGAWERSGATYKLAEPSTREGKP